MDPDPNEIGQPSSQGLLERLGRVTALPKQLTVRSTGTPYFFHWAEALFILSAIVGGVVVLVKAALDAARPFQMDYGEGQALAYATWAAHGWSTYSPSNEPPYVVNPYGPVPIYLLGACVKLFGVSFTVPRIVVISSGTLCAVLIMLLVRQWGGSTQAALASGLLFLTRPVVVDWLSRLKVDLIGLAFALAGLYVFSKPRWWYLSPFLFVAAVFSKVTLVAAPAACLLYLAVRKEGEKAFRFAASCILLGAFAFLLAQKETQGWFGFNMVWIHAARPYSLETAFWYLRAVMRDDRFLVLLALLLVYFVRSRFHLLVPLIYLGISGLISLTVGKLGGNFNYFLEWEAALCICAGLAYQLLRPVPNGTEIRPAPFGAEPTPNRSGRGQPAQVSVNAAPAGTVWSKLSPLLPVALAVLVLAGVYKKLRPSPNFSGCQQVYDYVAHSPGRLVLSENIGAEILGGKNPVVLEPVLWTHQVLEGGWSDAEVLRLIRSRQIGVIVLGFDVDSLKKKDLAFRRWPISVLNAIQENYTLAREFNCLDARAVYQPRGGKR